MTRRADAAPARAAPARGVEVYTVATLTSSPRTYRVTFIPAAYPALPAAVLPALWLAAALRRRRRRTRAGHCPACGYDLRATPGRRPECGATPGHAYKRP